MSYFMTISGSVPADQQIEGIEFLPADAAQPYIANLESKIAEQDGAPVYLVHDKETGTSDMLVADLENALIEGAEIENLPVFKLIQACFDERINFRIWWADNDLDAYKKNSKPVNDMESTLNSIKAGLGGWWHSR